MPTFDYDVFLSHCPADAPTARDLARKLRGDGLTVTWDKRKLKKSRALVVLISPSYIATHWGRLEHQTLRFRDPAHARRRFIPLLIADCTPPDEIAQFAQVDWRTPSEEAYKNLLAACRGEEAETTQPQPLEQQLVPSLIVLEGHTDGVLSVVVTHDGKTVVSGSWDGTLKLWDLETGRCCETLIDHTYCVAGVAVTPGGKTIVSASWDRTLKVWELETSVCLRTLKGHTNWVRCVAVTPDGKMVISGSSDETLKLWDLETGLCYATFRGHTDEVTSVAVTPDGKTVVSGSWDRTLRVWDLETGRCLATLEGHTGSVLGAALTRDGKTVVSGSADRTLKVWDVETGECRATLEGHTGGIQGVAIALDGRTVVSGSRDGSLNVWRIETGQCRVTYTGHGGEVTSVAVTPDGKRVVSASVDRTLWVWRVPELYAAADAVRYTNAKVVLVGESGVGKTGLALRLAEGRWEETGSTHGMSVWQLELPEVEAAEMEREVWLWDFAGQPDYRLIHQLYMDETALAVMVIDPQRDDPFEPLAHWEKALTVAVKHDPARLLVAGRCDRGGLTVSQGKVDRYQAEHGYCGYQDTSAQSGDGCCELKELIARHIPWDRLPWTATSRLFKSLKDAIIRVKEQGIVLTRISELRQRLQLGDVGWVEGRDPRAEGKEATEERGSRPSTHPTIEEKDLRAVVGLLAGQGIVQKLDFGDFVLLKPEQINNYASAVVRSARQSADEMGVVAERDVLEAGIEFKDMRRLDDADEKILLRAMLQTFLDRSLCARVETHEGTQLVFPSYFKQDRPEIPGQPDVVVTYGFSGTIDEIYSTLVVRLHYTNDFRMDQLWRYAADFHTLGKSQAGLMLTKTKDDAAEIRVYFEPEVQIDTRVAFIKYIHEHLKTRARDVTRVRSYVCPHCHTPLENRQAIKKRLERGMTDILCGLCEKRVELIDLIEEKFASDELLRVVQEMDAQAQINLDNESLNLILVGHAFSIAGEAGQIFRPVANSDWGIDGEIEFKNDRGYASGRRVYLQLKHGDSYLRTRQSDDKEIFQIKNPRHAEYWQAHEYPVMLVVRTSDGRIRWMNVTEYLKRHGPGTRQIVFEGEPMTALNVVRLRGRVLGGRLG